MLQRDLVAVEPEAERRPRGFNVSAHDRLFFVRETPIVDCDRTGRLPGDDDAIGGAAEVADVVVDPFDGKALV